MEQIEEVLQFIEENDVKFIRLAFTDIFGTLKNISINADDFRRVYTDGASFDASTVKGFMNVEASNLLLFPELDTMSILPWRPSTGRVLRFFCNIKYPDGSAFLGDGRQFLRTAKEKCEALGYTPLIGCESEFYLFIQDDFGNITKHPVDQASYLDVAPLDGCENIRREICFSLQEMSIPTNSSYHENGPGQNCITFSPGSAVKAADDLITYKNCVKTIANINGLYASFLPKPLKNESGNALRINIILNKNDRNIFTDDYDNKSEEQQYFIAGVLNRINEITAVLNPINNSYLRIGHKNAPKYAFWTKENNNSLIRVNGSQILIRSGDASCNPYFAYGLLLLAGVEGIKHKEMLAESSTTGKQELPLNLSIAMDCFEKSKFVKATLDKKIIDTFIKVKRAETKDINEKYMYANDKYFKFM